MSVGSDDLQVADLRVLWESLELAGAPLLGHERPGLDREAMDEICAPLGLTLSDECRTWWGWIDGVERVERPAQAKIGPWLVMSLDEAVNDTLELRELRASHADFPETLWRDSYISLVHGDWMIAADLAVASGSPSPIYSIDGSDDRFPDSPQLRSVGELVRLWTHCISSGFWRYDAILEHWVNEGKPAEVPRGLP